jgi:hypothetical protein
MVVPNEVQPSSQSMRGRGYSRSVAQHADTIPVAARPSVIIVIDSFAEKNASPVRGWKSGDHRGSLMSTTDKVFF